MHRLPARLRQLARRRGDEAVPQQALGRQHDQRQRIGAKQRRLAPQQMKILRRRRAVGDAHVDVGAQLQKTLGPRAGMIGPLSLVAHAAAAARATASGPTCARADTMNSSMITCAPLMKSPDCASQMTSRSGACTL